MTITQAVIQKVQELSEDRQRQVLDFITKLQAGASAEKGSLVDFFGLWAGRDTTEDEIAEARREMWGTVPREDI